ncbi:MAG: M28 family peptidase [Planctomycetota bacterium]
MRRHALALVLLASPTLAQAATQEPIDDKAVEILRQQGLEHGQVMEHLSWMCDVHGPRLTGSPNLHRAQDWAMATFSGWGLANVHAEEWGPFGRGWQCEHVCVEVVGDNPWPVIAYPKAWCGSLPGRVEADVVLIGDVGADDLAGLDLEGKVVLIETPREVSEPFDGPAKRFDAEALLTMADRAEAPRPAGSGRPRNDFRAGFQRRMAMMRKLFEKKPLALIDRSFKGDYGTVFVQGADLPMGDDGQRVRVQDRDAPAALPQFTIAVEHYNRMCRILKKGLPVRMAIELRTRFFDQGLMERNVVAELPGSDPEIGDEVVMLGAHFDSWHTGTGATDNGCGSAVVMEAMRLLTVLQKERGQAPRRTIRAALWSGEEQGLLGSRAYVRSHFANVQRGQPVTDLTPEHAKFAGYFNLDNGTGRIRGVYQQGNAEVGPIFAAWLRPFHDLDAHTLTLNDTGGTDHQAFDAAGLPGFQFIQDPVAYNTRTHHSNMDNWDHAVASDLQQAATIMASFAWHCAQRDAKLPRKALPPGSGGN